MALGILEAADEHVPGTVYVHDQERRTAELLDSNATLHRTKDGKTILVPQPNVADPNDPLLLPLWRRDFMLAILLFCAVIATSATPLLAANTVTVSIDLKVNFQKGSWLTAWHLLGAGASVWITVPWARVFGKRSTFIFASLLMIASSAWGGTTKSGHKYTQMVWARVLQGAAVAPFESLVNACVGDLYYVHERGPRMAITNVCLFAGAFLVPVIVGVITDTILWEWSFYFLAIFQGFALVLLFFFVPETAYRRPAALETDFTAQHIGSDETVDIVLSSYDGRRSDEKDTQFLTTHEVSTAGRKSYWKQLMPFDGLKTNENFFLLMLRPFPLFLHPAIVWASLMQGVIIGWTVMVGVIISLLFIGPPLFQNEEETGFVYAGPVVGSIVALFGAGIFSEVTTNFMIRRNGGKYEPEYRLLLAIPTLIFGAIGLYGFGIATSELLRYGQVVTGVFMSFIIMCMVTGTITSAQYILDAHRDISVEAFTTMIMYKNVFSFILTYYAYDWVQHSGIRTMFEAFGSIQVVICLLTIPMYVFGKRNRAFFHRHDLLKITKLR